MKKETTIYTYYNKHQENKGKRNYNTLNTINIRRTRIKETTIHTQYNKYQENNDKRNYNTFNTIKSGEKGWKKLQCTQNTINIRRKRRKETIYT